MENRPTAYPSLRRGRTSAFAVPAVFLAFLLVVPGSAAAGTLRGSVVESGHRSALVGVNIAVRETHLGAVSDVDGHYAIHDVPEGKHTVHFSIVGYKPRELVVDIPADSSATVTLDAVLEDQPVNIGVA